MCGFESHLRHPNKKIAKIKYNANTAYIIGVAIGDGNLSNPNGRATRLRVSCDNKYPLLIDNIGKALRKFLPSNKVSRYNRYKSNCTDISCYSNQLENILGWTASGGSKHVQNVRIPKWIFERKIFMKKCLKGLFETDGCIYMDRKYKYVNFTTIIRGLADDVSEMASALGYQPKIQKAMEKSNKMKYVVRVCKRSTDFIREINIVKE